MTILLVGILAVAVLPQGSDQGAFHARGFHDGNLALLRYAQKSAIAQRRTVCVSFAASSAILRIASVAGSSDCDAPLMGPNGDSPATVTANSGTSYVGTPADFGFDGLGRASGAQTIQVEGASHAIRVEAETGYVHE